VPEGCLMKSIMTALAPLECVCVCGHTHIHTHTMNATNRVLVKAA